MSHSVYKSTLHFATVQSIPLPVGSDILCAKEQHGSICIWWLHDESQQEFEDREITAVFTGEVAPHPNNAKYLGTILMHGGSLVYHVFDTTRNLTKPKDKQK